MKSFLMTYNGKEIRLTFMKYYDGNLALVAYTIDGQPYAKFTTNIEHLEKGLAAVDTNNIKGVDSWLEKNGIATYTGKVLKSGFCEYPVMKFNEELIAKYTT